MQKLRQRLRALESADDTTVQLLGETGTGKGVIAKWIHTHSGRAFEPFVAVDCTTIPANLVESELFGHEKGAFSGATGTKLGRVEAAGRGTLFLDEIGELELPIQAKLLRLLEEREYSRVGSTRTRNLEARVIAATNRNLERAVAERRFRADLRYRLEVFVVQVPPLRERGDDVLLLTAHFLEQQSRALGRAMPEILPEVLEALQTYPFPGNVRELRNLIEQALLLAEGPALTLSEFPVLERAAGSRPSSHPPHRAEPAPRPDLPYPLPGQPAPRPPVAPAPPAPATTLEAIRADALEDERRRIVAALKASGGNVAAAARALEMSRYRLLRQLAKLGMR